MDYFLITYNRRTGSREVEPFGGKRGDALRARFALERRHRGDPDVEIVVLGSDSVESLERTHPRYFQTFSELTSAAL